MQRFVVVLIVTSLFCVLTNVKGLENLIGTDIQKCLNCVCHARSGCWSRFNCARYSISLEYWIDGGSHTDGPYDNLKDAYNSCMKNENCILNTIKSYTDRFDDRDCNCDGVFDCKDRLAIHLFGDACFNPKFGDVYSKRFNHCAAQVGVHEMASAEGSCVVQVY
ncbi:hypothetical protein PPYR_12543 [Photinus pyralis]|uniref:lysozyme n=1 Tax=Photinus pyralis TaxID=7054 RepID=A0A1Y1K3M7_PHOPY|nr:uncharacterized protein LOC116177589 [Photinus pyralis]XP_031352465.1 uncharacterized protein LOC116177589 [Photinus pyralis]KAB0792923.1 hypothetical protein PPYR_12543 [Photinus pyralis]